jgi:hypothetical protein
MLQPLKQYLTSQKVGFQLNKHLSEWKLTHVSVPQGSVLFPLLYSVQVSDVLKRPGIDVSQFAEDIAAYTSDKNINYAMSNL